MRRVLSRLLATLAVLLALGLCLVAADGLVRREAEQRMAAALAGSLGTTPTVRLGGTSALYALATDRWPGLQISADRARPVVRGKRLPAVVDVRAADVTGLARGTTIRAGRITGTMDIGWADLQRLAGAPLTATPRGDLATSTTVDVLGEKLPVVVTGRPVLAADGTNLQLAGPTATVDGVAVPRDVLQGALTRVKTKLALPSADGLRVVGVDVRQGGARLHVAGNGFQRRHP